VVVWGTGEEERDLIYVSDLVDFVDLALRQQESKLELMKVGYGSSIPIRDLVRKIIEASGRSLEMVFDTSKPTIKTRLCLDTARANAFGWKRSVTLDDGIRDTLEWYQTHIGTG
jgi:nucleoside-diphosphate-sugar epimerase